MTQTLTKTQNQTTTVNSYPLDNYTYYFSYFVGNRWVTFSSQSAKRVNEEVRKVLMNNQNMFERPVIITRRRNYIVNGKIKYGHGNPQPHYLARRVVTVDGEVMVIFNRLSR